MTGINKASQTMDDWQPQVTQCFLLRFLIVLACLILSVLSTIHEYRDQAQSTLYWVVRARWRPPQTTSFISVSLASVLQPHTRLLQFTNRYPAVCSSASSINIGQNFLLQSSRAPRQSDINMWGSFFLFCRILMCGPHQGPIRGPHKEWMGE